MKTPFIRSEEVQKGKVANMFNSIAHRYDFLNHFLSAGIDRGWRRKAINQLISTKPAIILDIATGTGDLALEALRLNPQKIIGIDISEGMLAVGKQKIEKLKKSAIIDLQLGDSLNIQFEDASFQAVTVAFGVRNFEDLDKGLSEIYRVLTKNGRAVILEFSQPTNGIVRAFYNFYSFQVMPFLGKLFSKDKFAYTYLPSSVQVFPSGNAFLAHLSKAGFSNVRHISLTFGIAAIYVGDK